MPHWLPHKWAAKWRKPWTVKPGRLSDVRFKRRLRRHGFLSPNFRASEFASKSDNCGCPAVSLNRTQTKRAQGLAFHLEDARHRMNDRPIGVLSGLRSPCHNSCVGGASASEHMTGRAIDPIKSPAITQETFNRVMGIVFQHGGIGRGCVTGNVMHVDTGPERRWCYAGS